MNKNGNMVQFIEAIVCIQFASIHLLDGMSIIVQIGL